METSREACIRALGEAAEHLGASPSKADYEALGLRPSSGTIIRVMGGWNAAKEAAGLETTPSSGPRIEPPPSDVSLPAGTTWRELTVDQRWHYRHVGTNGRRTLDRRSELRAFVYEFKRSSDGCSRCGETDAACLEFHHLDASEKTMSVSSLITREPSEERLLAEIRKCELLCANCHRKEHYQVPDAVE